MARAIALIITLIIIMALATGHTIRPIITDHTTGIIITDIDIIAVTGRTITTDIIAIVIGGNDIFADSEIRSNQVACRI
jgi:hypothetical protein